MSWRAAIAVASLALGLGGAALCLETAEASRPAPRAASPVAPRCLHRWKPPSAARPTSTRPWRTPRRATGSRSNW